MGQLEIMLNLAGKLLVAMPSIGDARFSDAVVMICAHSDDYAMGLTINKPFEDLTLDVLLEQLDIDQDIRAPQTLVLDGGPVGTDRGFVLHSNDFYDDETTLRVNDSLCMSATREILNTLALGETSGQATLTLGYAGWGPGQLEYELSENAWIVSEPNDEIIFGQNHNLKWQLALDKIGVNPAMLHSGGGSA